MKPIPAINPDYHSLVIAAIREETPGVRSLVLQPEKKLQYKAGQFLTLVFQGLQGEERRSYSLSSCPAMDEPLVITVKRVTNGRYSRPLIDEAQAGDLLSATAPSGQFILPDSPGDYDQVFFFAAGIGITPVYSLIRTLLYCHADVEIILIYSNTSVTDTVFYKELLFLHEQFPGRFRPEFLFSSAADLSRARLSKWLLPQLLQVYGAGDKHRQLFYTCGPFAYMRMVILGLEEAGYTTDQIKKENFDTSRPSMKKEPPDKRAHKVSVRFKGAVHELTVQYPQTILHAARQSGLLLPYSCETGRCGSCTAQCTRGRIWMSYNEVLTDKDLRAGKVLTCTGYPLGGDAAIEI